MPYPRSNKEIQDSAFTMRSGNTTPFKQMGSLKKTPVGPVANTKDVKKEFIKKNVSPYTPDASRPAKPPKPSKPEKMNSTPSEPKASKKGKNKPINNTNIVSKPVTTSVSKPNPNLKIDDKPSSSTIGDVLTLPINVYKNPNKAIITTQNIISKGKKLVNKGKKKVKNFLNRTI